MSKRKTGPPRYPVTVCLTVPGDYYFGDPKPPYEAGYGEFAEWREAQLTRRKRPKEKRR